jgi:hypothetical protein
MAARRGFLEVLAQAPGDKRAAINLGNIERVIGSTRPGA